jgi:8-oxo-dGTP pyrophosphatase MutT (NUDIX family)
VTGLPESFTPPPAWLDRLVAAARQVRAEELSRFLPPEEGGRPSAVLMLFAAGPDGDPDVLLIERASTLRSHAGQPAFPGGARDPEDDGPADTALREAAEEVGLRPETVSVVATLPDLWLPVSSFVVTPVIGWWHAPHPVDAVDQGEVARVARVPVAELADPDNRVRVRHPSGYVGPAFTVQGMLVWGFTAGLLDRALVLGGWHRPWNRNRMQDLPPEALELAARTAATDAPRDIAR